MAGALDYVVHVDGVTVHGKVVEYDGLKALVVWESGDPSWEWITDLTRDTE